MANFGYDKALSFGRLATIANGNFPDILNLGSVAGGTDLFPDKAGTNADRMTVDVCWVNPAGGTSVTVTVQGSDDSSTWVTVGSNTSTLAAMQWSLTCVAISPNDFKFLRVTLACTGTFTGSAQALLNTYAGK